MEDLSKQILTEIEQDKVVKFVEDTTTFNAVKKYLLAVAYKHGVIEKGIEHQGNLNYALNMAWSAINPKGMPRSDEELGQNIRALAQAVSLVESGFRELEDIKELKKAEKIKSETKVNDAE